MMRNKTLYHFVFLMFSFFLILTQTTAQTGDKLQPYDESDAYAVYSAILPLNWTRGDAKVKSPVIQIETRAYEMCLKPEDESRKLLSEAISNYVEQNKKTWQLQRQFSLKKPYKLLTSEKLETIIKRGWWDEFYKRYPGSGGYLELSAVGFNRDKTIAVVYMGRHCGGECGFGTFYELQKIKGKWEPLKWRGSSCSWVS